MNEFPKDKRPIVLYHADCSDGFAAAHITHSFLEILGLEPELYPGVYQNDPPDVTGRDVVMVDFSYKRPIIQQMALVARSILILDHHKTAMADLANLGDFVHWFDHIDRGGIHVMFDMERSGAGLAWDYFYGSAHRRLGEPERSRPLFVEYIEDRDLWRKRLPGGDEFTIALRSYPQTIKQWDEFIGMGERGVERLIREGHDIQRYYRQQVEAMKANAYPATIKYGVMSQDPADPLGEAYDEDEIIIANSPYAFASEVAGELAESTGIGAAFFQLADGRWQYSLRSRGGRDVTPIALAFGGGGHAAAAGFTVPEPVHIRMSED